VREEIEEWFRLRTTSGKFSSGLVDELASHYVSRTLHVHIVLDEIAALEGVAGSRPSITKPATMFRGQKATRLELEMRLPATEQRSLVNGSSSLSTMGGITT
jgi:hypothetical protein